MGIFICWKRRLFITLFSVCLVACGGGGSHSKTSPSQSYTINANITGLIGSGLVLQNNLHDSLSISANGAVTFATAITDGQKYDVTVLTQPTNPVQYCAVTNGTGVIKGADIINIDVVCALNTSPIASLSFPTPHSLTDQTEIEVTGNASDPDGDPIQYLLVNGVSATSTDDYSTWRATIPLNNGDTSINLTVADSKYAVTNYSNVATVSNRGHVIATPTGMKIDAAGKILYVADLVKKAVISIDIDTGLKKIISGAGVGTGPSLSGLNGIAIDTNNRLLVVDPVSQSIFSIDLITGNRTILSSSTIGTGPVLGSPLNIDINNTEQVAYVTDRTNRAVVAIDLHSGDRAVVSSNAVGSGVSFSDLYDLAFNTSNNTILALDTNLKAIVEVSTIDGSRKIISDGTTGGGISMTSPQGIAYDAANNEIIVTCLSYVIKVDLTTGIRTLVSGYTTGNGGAFDSIHAVAVNNSGDAIYVGEYYNSNIVTVNAATGDRQNLTDSFIGSGGRYVSPKTITHGLHENHITLTDRRSIYDINLDTGTRQVVSGEYYGTGSTITGIDGGYYDPVNDALYVTNGTPASLVFVDTNTGNRTILSQPGTSGVGSGVNWAQSASTIAIKQSANTAYVSCYFDPLIYKADLTSGTRAILSSGTIGSGYPTYSMRDGIYDEANDRLLIVDSTSKAIQAIDPDTGDRSLLSSNGVSISAGNVVTTFPQIGNGVAFNYPEGIGINDNGDKAYIAERDTAALYEVNLISGNRTILSDSTHGTGPNFVTPSRVFIDNNRHVAFVADYGFRAIYAVELGSGNRVVISK